ncbi:putative coatomer subunit [Phaeomoniella chlamydospora]|uniref:Coatomer subunit delta n=1 Tax=Phaeomoniella chlamydospora TaxID=158046 RepID=A0A0G2DVE9_PHACM|nr:putative coatomer subunit [Phaeomoniella chlamydospora]
MVVIAASIVTRGGKAVLSRQFREIARSRVEALLASFPKLADSGTQHTVVEQDNVRFVYQPLDELYMVLITNRQSNILQDIDSLHLFAQVVSTVCKRLDEREILRNAFELLSAFDELVTLGYRENLSLNQIKTFLEMESHEERIQEIIARNKELEASEERKRKAKQLELQRKEAARSGAYGRGQLAKTPSYPVYTPPSRPSVPDSYDSYEAERNKTFNKSLPTRGKGMQLGKKSKTTDIYEKVRGDLGPEVEDAPLVSAQPTPTAAETKVSSSRPSLESTSPIHVAIAEVISAKLSREGALQFFEVKGDLNLRISDPSFTKVSLSLVAQEGTHKAQFRTHPNVDKALFTSNKTIQLKDTTKRFPSNNSIGVLRWRVTAPADSTDVLPLTFTVWVNKSSDDSYTITIEYEFNSTSSTSYLRDVVVTIPYTTSEPAVSSFDAMYEVTGDSLEWTIGHVDADNSNGAFEFEAQAEDEAEFFPMSVRFEMAKPFVDVDVTSVKLLEGAMDEEVNFEKVIRSVGEGYVIE